MDGIKERGRPGESKTKGQGKQIKNMYRPQETGQCIYKTLQSAIYKNKNHIWKN